MPTALRVRVVTVGYSLVTDLVSAVTGREAAIPRQDGGRYQPLQPVCAVEPMQEATARAMEAGVDRPIEPALDLDHVVVDWETVREYAERGTFFDVNTVEDMETASQRLQSGED